MTVTNDKGTWNLWSFKGSILIGSKGPGTFSLCNELKTSKRHLRVMHKQWSLASNLSNLSKSHKFSLYPPWSWNVSIVTSLSYIISTSRLVPTFYWTHPEVEMTQKRIKFNKVEQIFRTRVEPQQIVAARLLYCLQYPVPIQVVYKGFTPTHIFNAICKQTNQIFPSDQLILTYNGTRA